MIRLQNDDEEDISWRVDLSAANVQNVCEATMKSVLYYTGD